VVELGNFLFKGMFLGFLELLFLGEDSDVGFVVLLVLLNCLFGFQL
jgi:hypothetical protein